MYKWIYIISFIALFGLGIAGTAYAITVGSDFDLGNVNYLHNAQGLSIGTTTVSSGVLIFPDGTIQATAYLGGTQTIVAGNVQAGEFGSNTGGGNYSFPANVGIGTTGPSQKLHVAGNALVDGGNIYNNNTNHRWNAAPPWNYFYTQYGYIALGPANTSWAHIYTDRPGFYFNKALYVLGSLVWNNGNVVGGTGISVSGTTITNDLGTAIEKGEIANSGTLSFNWADSEVSNSVTAGDLVCTNCIGTTEIGDSYVLNTGDTMTGTLDVNSTIKGDLYQSDVTNSYDKIRVYPSSSYTIGMKSAQTYGGLGDWAMTFTMNNDTNRGWLWRDEADAASDGAMSLTTTGVLTVKGTVTAATPTTGSHLATKAYVDSAVISDTTCNNSTCNITNTGTLDGLNASSFIRSNASDNVSGHTEWQDSQEVRLGNGADMRMDHNGANTFFYNYTGDWYLRNLSHGARIFFQAEDAAGTNRALLYMDADGRVGNRKVQVWGLQVEGDSLTTGKTYIGSTDSYFYRDTSNRIATPDQFYVQSSSANTYLYSTNTYLGAGSGDAIHLRGNIFDWTSGGGGIINASGNVGIGTTSPGAKLEVAGGDITISKTGGNAVLNLEPTSTGGAVASAITHNRGGVINWWIGEGGNGDLAHFAYNDSGGFLGNRLIIQRSTGNVGIGITPDNSKFQVVGLTAGTGSQPLCWGPNFAGNAAGSVVSPSSGGCTTGSSITLKENLRPMKYGLDDVMKLQPRLFSFKDYKEGEGRTRDRMGFIAEEMEKIVPEVIFYDQEDGSVYGIAYEELTALLAKGIQELKAENDELKAEDDELRTQVQSLRERIEALESK